MKMVVNMWSHVFAKVCMRPAGPMRTLHHYEGFGLCTLTVALERTYKNSAVRRVNKRSVHYSRQNSAV